jgi:hypothetical protein
MARGNVQPPPVTSPTPPGLPGGAVIQHYWFALSGLASPVHLTRPMGPFHRRFDEGEVGDYPPPHLCLQRGVP